MPDRPAVQRIITVSASFGAAGSLVAPRLASVLGLRFLDRTVSVATASTAVAAESATEEERASTPPARWISALAQLAVSVPGVSSTDHGLTGQVGDMRSDTTAEVVAAATAGEVVILGRAGAVVLADHPSALHVRLDGPWDARVARAAEIESVSEPEARRRGEATDRLRTTFVKRLYGRDPEDPRLYHLVIDTTVLAVDDVVELVERAALARWRRLRSSGS